MPGLGSLLVTSSTPSELSRLGEQPDRARLSAHKAIEPKTVVRFKSLALKPVEVRGWAIKRLSVEGRYGAVWFRSNDEETATGVQELGACMAITFSFLVAIEP
jgi:hypothetical protein